MAERRALPLFAWGAARWRAGGRRRSRGIATALGCVCVATTVAVRPAPRLVWNASASAPLGLYRVEPGTSPARGDMVIALTPAGVRALAAGRGYIPETVPLVKRVAGIAGDRVCAVGGVITINRQPVATRRSRDRIGRALPWWSGCRTLGARTLFLLMAESSDSFDGRYFGPTPSGDLIGRATALCVW